MGLIRLEASWYLTYLYQHPAANSNQSQMLALESLLKRPQHEKKGFDELLATTATDRNECKEGIVQLNKQI